MAASSEAVTWVGALDHAKHRGLHSATTVICAYVTSGCTANDDARPPARACAPRHHATSYGELVARGTSGARVVRGVHRTLAASSGWGSDEGRRCLRCSAGAGRLGAALDRGWQRGDHRHEQNNDAPGAARLRAAPARSSLHRTFDPRSARNRSVAAGAFSVHDRSNDQVARSFLALTSVNAFVTSRHQLRPSGTSPPTERRLLIRPSAERPLLQVRVLRRRPEWLRSLQGRVTIATSAPKHRIVSAMLTDKRLEYCAAGAPLQGSVRQNGECKTTSTAFRGAFRLDIARV